MRLLFGVRVRDVNFSFKLVHRRVLDRIALTARTVFIDGQLLAESVRQGFEIVEVPIIYKPRRHGESSFNSLRAAWDTLLEMLRHRLLPKPLSLQKAAVAALPARVKVQAERTEFAESRPWSEAAPAPAEPVVPKRRAAGQK